MASERDWVQALVPRLEASLRDCSEGEWRVDVCSAFRLTYANEITRYHEDGSAEHHKAGYETDILVSDVRDGGDWIPRLILECKLGNVTTHDALTYSAKAATHKHVHPYLRYGALIGGYGGDLPGRLIRHGAYFDFMMVWQENEPSKTEWSELSLLVVEEVKASRLLQALLTENRVRGRKRFHLLHRPLRLSEMA
jgi:hypothetical protein